MTSFAFFVEMAWKSALIAGAALLLAGLVRSWSAADRTALLRLAIVMLLGLPAVALLLPGIEVEMAVPAAAEAEPLLRSALPAPAAMPAEATATVSAAPVAARDDPGMLVALLYLGGLMMVGLRLASGLWTLRRWTAAASPLGCPEWQAALARALADPAAPRFRLLVSYEAPSPLSWGWRRPVILLDADTLRRADDADAILAHEIAHIARGDWPTLILSRLAVALFWFNPLVWWLERVTVQEAEEAADGAAAGRMEPARYAQILLNCAQQAGTLPVSSIASGCLRRRIKAVLDGSFSGRRRGSVWTAAAMLGCVAVAAPVAATRLVPALAAAPAAPARPVARIGPLTISMTEAPVRVAAAPLPPAPPTPPPAAEAPLPPEAPAVATTAPEALPPSPPAPVSPPAPPTPPAPVAPPRPAEPVLDVETLVQMRVHGVTGDYIEALAAIGPHYRQLTPEQMVRMRIHGVTPDYVRDLAASGYPAVGAEQLIRMKIHGVTPAGARRAALAPGARPSAEELIDRAIHRKL